MKKNEPRSRDDKKTKSKINSFEETIEETSVVPAKRNKTTVLANSYTSNSGSKTKKNASNGQMNISSFFTKK